MHLHTLPPVAQTASQVQVHRVEMSGLFIHCCSSPINLLLFPLSLCAGVTAWHYYDRGAVALLWQQAGRPGYVLVKRTACQRERD